MGQEIFEGLIGRDGAKAILRSALKSGNVNVLMEGDPAGGKSVALHGIENSVPGARFLDSSGLSERKLRDTLSEDPEILLLDELDDASPDVFAALSIAMSAGRVTKAVSNDVYDRKVNIQIFGACNNVSVLPAHIRSRFQIVEFGEYTDAEFIEVSSVLLAKEVDWIDCSETAREIAETIFEELGSKDVRDARDVARLASGPGEVGELAVALHDPTAKVESDPVTRCDILTSRMDGSSDDIDSEIEELISKCMD